MKLPNCERAVVAKEKITEYLLVLSHPRGGQKAAFFIRRGFSMSSWELFASALLRHACAHEVSSVTTTAYGTLYAVEGRIDAPDGRSPMVRSVWMIDAGADTPWLISAYPLGRIGA